MRIALVGAPASGKSTVAADTLASLREQGISAELVNEFCREFLVANGGINNAYEQVFIAREQRRREDILASKAGLVVISDSPLFLNFTYASLLASRDRGLRKVGLTGNGLMLEITYKEYLQAFRDYDLIVYVERPTEVNRDDGVRIHSEQECVKIDRIMRALLDMHGGPDVMLTGTRQERTSVLLDRIQGMIKLDIL